MSGERQIADEMARLQEQDRQHHFHPQTNPVQLTADGPVLIKRAEGIYLYTADGRRIIDGRSGGYCTNIGYGNERLFKVAFEAMKQLSYATSFGRWTNPWTAALSEKLASLAPNTHSLYFFGSTGSDAVESAIKMALYYWRCRGEPKKRAVIARRHSYHGLTLFASSLTGIEFLHTPFGLPVTDLVHHTEAPYWYAYGRGRSREEFGIAAAAALEKKIQEIGPEHVAAFIGEPIQASNNFVVPPESYWPEVQRICAQYEVLLIADEVVTGFGKTGRMFGFQSFNFEPDLFVMAKGLSSGYFPMSSVGIGRKVADVLQNRDGVFAHGFTNCGHPVGSAVALENINIIQEESMLERVRSTTGPHLGERLTGLLEVPCVGEVRSRGIMAGVEIDATRLKASATRADSLALAERVGEAAWRNGLSARPVDTALALIFPLIINETQLDEAIEILRQSFAEALS